MSEAEATHRIAQHLFDLTYEGLPELAVSNAKVAILDTIGVTLAGSRIGAGQRMLNYVASNRSENVSTVFTREQGASPELAALANGSLAHVLDFDDRYHASTHTLPATLAVAEPQNSSGREVLLSYIAGRELRLHLDVEFRLGRGGEVDPKKGRGPGWRGWHETGVSGALAATAAAAKILRLDLHQFTMALGIAGSLASGLIANFGTDTKSLHAGNAARNGVLAASLAQNGFSADPAILTVRRGFVEAICYPDERDIQRVADNLVSWFHIVERGIRIKPYPSCTGTHQFIEMARQLARDHTIHLADVERIELSRIIGATTKRDIAHNEIEAKFSPGFVAIATLVDGQLTLDNCSDDFIARADIQELISKLDYRDSETGYITIYMKDGRSFHQESVPVRDLESDKDILAKFHDCADRVVGVGRANEIAAMVASLESVERIDELTRLVRA